jgi:hypothetical protein
MSEKERAAWKIDLVLDKILHMLAMLHVFISPYTKVEESFNLQVTTGALNENTRVCKHAI